jgi:hypothetical protein
MLSDIHRGASPWARQGAPTLPAEPDLEQRHDRRTNLAAQPRPRLDEFRELGRKFTIDCDAICDALG